MQGTGNANFYFATAMAYACLQVRSFSILTLENQISEIRVSGENIFLSLIVDFQDLYE